MKILISIILSLIISYMPSKKADAGRNIEENQKTIQKEDIERIKLSYKNLLAHPNSPSCEQDYFDAFPNSFSAFNKVFGNLLMDESVPGYYGEFKYEPAPLNGDSYYYVQSFFKLKSIDKKVFFNKIINVCIRGVWYADAINYFRGGSENVIVLYPKLFNQILSQRTDSEIKSFWRFIFDGPHPRKVLSEQLEKIKDIDNRIYLLMTSALKEIQDEHDGHGH